MSGEKEAVELLFDNGADVNVKDEYGSTPLHDASLGRHNESSNCLSPEVQM